MNKFSASFNGIKIALSHKAVRVQFCLALLAIIGGIIIHLDSYEWLCFAICICFVINSEIFNTAIEKIGDYLDINNNDQIKAIKDLSSGAVLISAIGALMVCIICLIRRF